MMNSRFQAKLPSRVRVTISITFAIAFFIGSCAKGAVVKIEGLIEGDYFSRSNFFVGRKEAKFEVWIDDCSWRIQVRFLETYDKSKEMVLSLDAYSDGTNIFGIKTFNVNPDGLVTGFEPDYAKLKSVPSQKLKEQKATRRLTNEANAWVVSSRMFHDPSFEIICPVWLSFASTCFFEGSDPKEIEPFISLGLSEGIRDNPLKVPVQLVRRANNPEALERVVLYSNGFRNAPAFASRFTNAVYEAASFTNYNGRLFPLRSTLSVMLPAMPSKTATNLVMIVKYGINLSKIGGDIALSRPILPKRSFVYDYRLPKIGPISYFADTNNWLTVSDLETNDVVFPGRVHKVPVREARLKSKPMLWILFLSTITVVSISILALVWGREKSVN